jgi:alkylation response protein AidB-like acyl-CoA dehydrogenase
VAGVFAPKGRASPTDSGWHVTGRWAFATGCELASWIYVQCLVTDKRRVVLSANNEPLTRLAVFRADEVEILDTWDVVGLRGTGSHDVRLEGRTCPGAWTCALADHDGTGIGLHSVPLMDHAGLLVASVAVGIAAGALGDIAQAAATGRRPVFSPTPMADDPVFQDRLGEAHMGMRAARALLYAQARLVESAMAGCPLSVVDRASLRATCHHVTTLAAGAVDAAYTLGRSASIANTSSLQRRLRDIHTVTQHAWSGSGFSRQLGATLIGGAAA